MSAPSGHAIVSASGSNCHDANKLGALQVVDSGEVFNLAETREDPMPKDQLGRIEHIVVLMLENRSFDHMLGFLYSDTDNRSPAGAPFEGLTGTEANSDATGKSVSVFRIDPSGPAPYFAPGANPGEGYSATNLQLFGADPAPVPAIAGNGGFVTNFAATLALDAARHRPIQPGTTPADIMGMFTPELLPVLSGLARGYAVCDHWFCSVPTETIPNRAFVAAGTSQGHMNDSTKSFTVPTIFGLLSTASVTWKIYGYDSEPLTRLDFPDTTAAPDSHFGLFPDFQHDAAEDRLPGYAFLEPSWGSSGNSQHPPYDVAKGEQLIHDVYRALRDGPGWNQTLLIVTYDEHGGCYDHVPPPTGAIPPDGTTGEYGFDFTRFGVRVPTVVVSPLIAPGTVFRVPSDSTPLDHTSILKTVEARWGLRALTARDAAAPDIADVLTLSTPRADDPLDGVVVPTSAAPNPAAGVPSHLQEVQAELVSQLPLPPEQRVRTPALSTLETPADYDEYIRSRIETWRAQAKGRPRPTASAPGRGG
jgi:phospholipase C